MPEPIHSPVTVAKLGYVGYETPDVDRLVEYYTKTLDFVLVERGPEQAFLTTDFSHHSVVIERSAAAQARSFVGFAIREDLDTAERRLREAGYGVERRRD